MKTAIIGSFRKFYKDISEVIRLFRKEGCTVTSPYLSDICDSRDDFVIFLDDDSTQSNDEIQTETLRRILNADAVYVYDPEGYVGKTTCFEIGFLMEHKKPLYYLEQPSDLPIPVATTHILSPYEFVKRIKSQELFFGLPVKEKTKNQNDLETVYGEQSKLIVCGSMKHYERMKELQKELIDNGIYTVVPEDEGQLPANMSEEEFNEFKKRVSRDYLKKIRSKGTYAVLVLNEEKNVIENYIGANTFVEIAVAFSWGRKIYLYNDIYEPYKDELVSWNAVSIHKDISLIKKDYIKMLQELGISNTMERIKAENYQQMTMFDYVVG